ncbi:hypothetical protein H4R34_000968 [Dimargaris verticillata]|uniref:Uncharacterized protein n=1 Tax=Dimargaris verticillata TaxID=2761393 RepID=A0A9W8BAT8_9FUNG|nr:hypothetical protein H4R34_000968 [Dimargaris verticillata]
MFRTSALVLLAAAVTLLTFNVQQVSSKPARSVKVPEGAISNDSSDNPFNAARTLTITQIVALPTPTDPQCAESSSENITDGSCGGGIGIVMGVRW